MKCSSGRHGFKRRQQNSHADLLHKKLRGANKFILMLIAELPQFIVGGAHLHYQHRFLPYVRVASLCICCQYSFVQAGSQNCRRQECIFMAQPNYVGRACLLNQKKPVIHVEVYSKVLCTFSYYTAERIIERRTSCSK